MKDNITGFTGLLSNLLVFSIENIAGYITIACSVAIAITTCFVQMYRLWRDRDKDLKKEDTKSNDSPYGENENKEN